MKDKKYIIKAVYDHDGHIKPERIGMITAKPCLTSAGFATVRYFSLADGTPYENKMLCTSQVVEWHEEPNRVLFSTLNSKYIFEEVEDE